MLRCNIRTLAHSPARPASRHRAVLWSRLSDLDLDNNRLEHGAVGRRLRHWLLPSWHDDRVPDEAHPHRRRFTARYRRKRGWVKNIWIASGLLVLANPVLNLACAVALASSFLSFMLLDETP
jgi:hypothetical protein